MEGEESAPPGRRAHAGGLPGVDPDRGGPAAGGELQPSGRRQTIEGGHYPDRDAQFAHFTAAAVEHLAAGQPVISVDDKKKELVGNFRNGGREYRPAGEAVVTSVYDFTGALGKVTPTACTTGLPARA